MKVEITGGEVSDYNGCDALLEDLPPAKVFIADKGHDADAIRNTVTEFGGAPVIPTRSNHKQQSSVDGLVHALRN